jgi:cobalt-zinc-cadmium efflux system outer membrane protein
MADVAMGLHIARRTTGAALVGTCLLALLPTARLAAQAPSPGPLTLDLAVERALAANPTIAAARLGRAVRQAGIAVAGERPNPEVTFEVEKETPKQSFGVAMPIELGGKRGKRIAVEQAALEVDAAELQATIAQVRNDVRRGYFDTVVAEAKLTVLRELRDLAQRARATAQTRFEQGDAPRLEVLQADLVWNTAEAEVSGAGGTAAATRARLNALLGLPSDTAQTLSTPLDAAGAIDTSVMLGRARAANAELRVLDRRLDEQRAKVALAHALRVPDAVPTATLTHDAQPEFTYGWRAGVAITLPVFTSHKAGVTLEDATLAQLAAQREAALFRIGADVTAAAATAEAQRQGYARYRDVVLPQARQVEEMAQDSYRLGQSGLTALLQALQLSREVRLRSLDAVAQFQAGMAELERAIGAPLP